MKYTISTAKTALAEVLGIDESLIATKTLNYFFEDDIPESTSPNMTEEKLYLVKLSNFDKLVSDFENIDTNEEAKGTQWDILKSIIFKQQDKNNLKIKFPVHEKRGLFYKIMKQNKFDYETSLECFNDESLHERAGNNKKQRYHL